MNSLKLYLHKDMKSSLLRWMTLFWGISVLVALIALNNGINTYYKSLNQKNDFKSIQKISIDSVYNFLAYSFLGVRIISAPNPCGALFDSAIDYPSQTAKIDSMTQLDIYRSFKGEDIFNSNNLLSYKFSFIIYQFFTILAIILGFSVRLDAEWLRVWKSGSSLLKTFILTFLSKLIIMVVFIIMLALPVFGLMYLRGALIGFVVIKSILYFLLLAILLMAVFVAAGIIAASCRNTCNALSIAFLAWIVLVFFIPDSIAAMTKKKAESISSCYQVQLKQLKKVMVFEKKMVSLLGTFDHQKINSAKVFIEEFWKKDSLQIEEIERRLMIEISDVVEYHQFLSGLCPTAFYQCAVNEMSGKGYENYLAFYKNALKVKRDFLRFWIDKVYYEKAKKVESFVKKEEDVFYPRSVLPSNFGSGLAVAVLYVLVFMVWAYFRLSHSVVFPVRENISYAKVNMMLGKRGRELINVAPEHTDILRGVLNAFFVKDKRFQGKIAFEGRPLHDQGKVTILYIPAPSHLPGFFKVRTLAGMMAGLFGLDSSGKKKMLQDLGSERCEKRFDKLDHLEKAKLLVDWALLAPHQILIFYNFDLDVPDDDKIALGEAFNKFRDCDSLLIVGNDHGGNCFYYDITRYHNLIEHSNTVSHHMESVE